MDEIIRTLLEACAERGGLAGRSPSAKNPLHTFVSESVLRVITRSATYLFAIMVMDDG
jgi:hypothetical protein